MVEINPLYLNQKSKVARDITENPHNTAQGQLPVGLKEALSSDIDSIDVAKISKGGVITALDSTSGDSNTLNCDGFNSILLYVDGSATVKVLGSLTNSGTFFDCEGMSKTVTTGGVYKFNGIPDYIKVNANATCTVKIQPYNA